MTDNPVNPLGFFMIDDSLSPIKLFKITFPECGVVVYDW